MNQTFIRTTFLLAFTGFVFSNAYGMETEEEQENATFAHVAHICMTTPREKLDLLPLIRMLLEIKTPRANKNATILASPYFAYNPHVISSGSLWGSDNNPLSPSRDCILNLLQVLRKMKDHADNQTADTEISCLLRYIREVKNEECEKRFESVFQHLQDFDDMTAAYFCQHSMDWKKPFQAELKEIHEQADTGWRRKRAAYYEGLASLQGMSLNNDLSPVIQFAKEHLDINDDGGVFNNLSESVDTIISLLHLIEKAQLEIKANSDRFHFEILRNTDTITVDIRTSRGTPFTVNVAPEEETDPLSSLLNFLKRKS